MWKEAAKAFATAFATEVGRIAAESALAWAKRRTKPSEDTKEKAACQESK